MQLVNGRWVDESSLDEEPGELLESGGPERRMVSPNPWLVIALVLAVVAVAVLGGYVYVDHRPTAQERAAIGVVQSFYAALNAHDDRAVLALMTSSATHTGIGAVGGDVGPISGVDLQVFLSHLLGTGDFFAELTGPPAVTVGGTTVMVSVPNRLGARLADGREVSVAGVSLLSMVSVEGHLRVAKDVWWEQAYLGWTTAAVPTVGPWTGCPAGTLPDVPGPVFQARPAFDRFSTPVAMDTRLGRVVALATDGTWLFDVCTNTWARMNPADQPPVVDETWLVYEAASDLVVALAGATGPWVYNPSADTWTRLPLAGMPDTFWSAVSTVVDDPATGQLLLRSQTTGGLWAYNPSTGTVAAVDQGRVLPPKGSAWGFLMTFDPGADRLVLVLTPDPALGPVDGQTWVFDPTHHIWARTATYPALGPDWAQQGTPTQSAGPITFDTATGRIVTYVDNTIASYAPTSHTWQYQLDTTSWPATAPDQTAKMTGPYGRMGYALIDDPVNQRVLLLGGQPYYWATTGTEIKTADDVWAYNVATNAWTELVPSQTRFPWVPGYPLHG
jgi:hypothetical protein